MLTLDAVGPCGAPNYAPGFQITVDPVTLVATIGKGRFYIDGFLCENEEDVPYADQPDLLDPPDFVALATGMGVPATAAHTAEELTAALAQAAAEPGPHLIDAVLSH